VTDIARRFFTAEKATARAASLSVQIAANLSHVARVGADLAIAQLEANLSENDLDTALAGIEEDIKHPPVNLSTKVAEDLSVILNAVADLATALAAVNVGSAVDIKIEAEQNGRSGHGPQSREHHERHAEADST